MTTPHDTDLISVLTQDHREVEEMFAELERIGTGDLERRQKLTEKVIIELVRHSVAEEAYLYPAARELLPDGDEIADRELAEHAEAEKTMKHLEEIDVKDAEHVTALNRLMREVRQHVQEEEFELFPQLRRHATSERLAELGEKVEAIKDLAPTRPHPATPQSPTAQKLLGPLTGLVDRMRDTISGRGKD
ncbi:hemerythrin domain-containing protein [Sinosporangium siamense]|uniref:Hemerythrin n=1 Tax=Sinosporangium siamense TaxID=1367973 RepID=A0A919RLD7_9ACTN|nr:hemerythrin domain-containing protein [Sinosporangium siamense]GII94544.1 hemerythrin [Sinosporangium siamense]